MRNVPEKQVIQRIAFENPWWETRAIDPDVAGLKRRAYFRAFARLVEDTSVRRAVILMGPRRVGKTVLLYHVIQEALEKTADPKRLCYLSVDHPIYNGLGLEELVVAARRAAGAATDDLDGCVFFFDEIQYLRDWEQHLKSLVDSYPRTKWIASGSSAAALRLKSDESGAGRFTDFLLPPLTFHEYVFLLGEPSPLESLPKGEAKAKDIEALNALFIDYLNFGGYPEVALSETIRADPARFVRNDIIDKVLLRDLPSLYGISDIQELNSLFMTLAFNTGNEVSLEGLSKRAGVAKNTIKRYIEYLEAAFLVRRVHRIDDTARRFQRATHFKVYLTNPSLRAALFTPITAEDDDMGAMVETAIFAQWFHSRDLDLHYARWKHGEVDIVRLRGDQKPAWVVEAKWTDRYATKLNELQSLIEFCRYHDLKEAHVTTRTAQQEAVVNGVTIGFLPASVYCYMLGQNLV